MMDRRLGFALALAAVGLGQAALAIPARAIPGEGANSDTPGTSATVSTRTVTAGSAIQFSISGFPAGEVVNVKVDDGLFCSASATHGACVVHQQRVAGNGTASGSFLLPGDLKPGKHWLRFLATADLGSGPDGVHRGYRGYTLRGNSTFTIVSGSATGQTPTTTPPKSPPATGTQSTGPQGTGTQSTTTPPGSTPSDSAASPGAEPSSGAAPTVATPGPLVLRAGAEQSTPPASDPSTGAPALAEPSGVVEPGSIDQSAPSEAAVTAAAVDQERIPWWGLGGGLLLVALAGLMLAPRPLFRRRRG